MDTKTILNDASVRMQKALDHLEEELLNVRAGKASPNVLNGVMVDYFGRCLFRGRPASPCPTPRPS